MAAGTIIIAGPAGAVTTACTEKDVFLPLQGQPSGLEVACSFTSAGQFSSATITDYADAEWHAGAARNVLVAEQRGQAGQPANSTAGSTHIHNTAASGTSLPITNADSNHSIEGPGIAPGTFMRGIAPNGDVLLNLNTVAGGPLCPTTTDAACHPGGTTTVKVANSADRSVKNGGTTVGSNVVTSAGTVGAHFCKPSLFGCATAVDDTGARVSGGSLPDGATIATVDGYTQVTLQCVGCIGGPGIPAFTGVVTASNVILSITRPNAPTSARYVTDGTFTNPHTITSIGARFATTDIGLTVVGVGITASYNRIVAVAANGNSATLNANNAALVNGANKKFTIGLPTKNAPATNSIVGRLAIGGTLQPAFLTAGGTPCSVGITTGFTMQAQWNNPGAYDPTPANGTTQFSNASVPATSVAEFQIATSSTTFAGFLQQNVTVLGGVNTTTGWVVKFGFMPLTIGICPGTSFYITWTFDSMSLSQQVLPGFTGPESESRVRGLRPEPQGTSTVYAGGTGAEVTTNAGTQPTNTNSCTIMSPNPGSCP
jgi:hypothetical protein